MRILSLFLLIVSISSVALAQQNVGTEAQNFSANTIEDESIELDNLKGNVVLMTFWSTRCPICASEIPDLNELVTRNEGEKVVFLGLAWQDKAKLDVFLEEKPFKFKIIPQAFGILLKYADRDPAGRLSMGFPSHFIVDQSGTVVYKASGYDKTKKIASTIKRLLRKGGGSQAGNQ